MNRKIILLSVIILLATFLRLYKLDTNPPATYGDEISFAWNAWNILKTGSDEWGVRYPLQFRAFEDYKSPLPVYLLVPLFQFFGMTTLVLRFPVAMFSVLTVILTYLLVKKMLNVQVALIAAFLLTISPWHLHLSRGYFEATIALFFVVAGVYTFLLSDKRPRFLFVAALSFVLSLYTYFTPRILLPFILPLLTIYYWNYAKKQWKTYVAAFFLCVILCLPLLKLTLFDNGSNRMRYLIKDRMDKAVAQASLDLSKAVGPYSINKYLHNRYSEVGRAIAFDYLQHFSFDFWYLSGDSSLRYFMGRMGMFHVFELPFVLIGIYALFRKAPRVAVFFVIWMMIAAIPAGLVGRSFGVRSLTMLPAPFVFAGYGIYTSGLFLKSRRGGLARVISILIVTFIGISVLNYLARYYFEYPITGYTWWGGENKLAIDYARAHESEYEKIFVSDFYTGAPLAYAFYTQYDPAAYKEALKNIQTIADNRHVIQLGKYYFGSLDLDEKRLSENIIPPHTLYIGRHEEAKGEDKISAPDDGRLLFTIHKRP